MSRRRVFVGNVNPRTSWQEVRDLLAGLDGALAVQVPLDRQTGEHRGFAFVEFRDSESAEQAMRGAPDSPLAGLRLRLRWAVSDSRAPNSGASGKPRRRPQPVAGEADPWGDSAPIESSEWADKRSRRSGRGGKHGSDRRRSQGTRRFID